MQHPPTHHPGLDIDPHHLTPGLPLYLLKAAGLAGEETSPHQIPQLRPPAGSAWRGSTWLGQALAAVFLLISVPLCVSLLFLPVFSALLYSLYYYYYHYY